MNGSTFRAVQPMLWAGMTKVPGGPMVCGACMTPEACDVADRCARASDEDYDRGLGIKPVKD